MPCTSATSQMDDPPVGGKRVAVRSPSGQSKLFLVDKDFSNLVRQVALAFGQDASCIVLMTATSGAVVSDTQLIRDDETLVLNTKPHFGEWISLNVGGRRFTTTRSTLTSLAPDSMLGRMFAAGPESLPPGPTDASGAFLIDRSPEYFEPIIGYLRHGQLILNPGLNARGVLAEARFYGLQDLVLQLEQMVDEEEERQRIQETSLSRRDVVAALIRTTCTSELRFQGVDLSGADLSKLDLRHINFKYAILRKCNLLGTNLSYACLERADLSHSRLDGAVLIAAKMVCANLEFCSLRGVNCEAPYDEKTTMEGVNLKVSPQP